MNYRRVFNVVGISLCALAGLLLLPMLVALYYSEPVLPFAVPAAASGLTGVLLTRIRPKSTAIYAREGYTAVTMVWLLMSLVGALPFVLSGDIPRYVDAFFETMSGFTTTGSSILTDVEAVSRACLFWRSFTHFIGGMGVLVFVMAIVPMSQEHSMHIMRAEVPGPVVGKLVPKARDTAKILYLIYALMTAAETILLIAGGMTPFDALAHAFGTAGTGGFSTRNASVGAYSSLYIEMVIATFLILFGINFNLYFFLVTGRARLAFKSEELHVYLAIIAVSVLLIGIGVNFRDAYFNVASIITTAGFGTADFTLWPMYAQVILIILMFVGACAGSTGGGMKVSRIMILFKTAVSDIEKAISPRRVKKVRIEGRSIDETTIRSVCSFAFLYLLILLGSTLIVALDNYDFATSFSASLACLSNIGPGISLVGPAGNFAGFSDRAKITLSLIMLLGRLEIFPVVLTFGQLFSGRKRG